MFSLVHAAVDLPRPLVDAPDELRVVFVVDTSVSAGDTGVARALQLVDAVLDVPAQQEGDVLARRECGHGSLFRKAPRIGAHSAASAWLAMCP